MATLLTRLLFLGGMIFLFFPPATEAGNDFSQKRVIFDEGIGWTTREGADRTLRRIREAGFNVYVPCVWHGRGASWPSDLAPWDFYLKPRPMRGDDPLGYLVSRARKMGIEVHPWFTVVLRQSDLHPEFAEAGTPEQAFDVHDGRFRGWISDLIAEVARRYDVDGINLDYVRAMGPCTSPSCREEYHRRYGRDLPEDLVQYQIKPGRAPTFGQWQEDVVSGLVREISEKVRREKPGILISADVAPDLLPPVQGQDSLHWSDREWVDRLFRMDYGRRIDVERTESLRKRMQSPDALTLLISNNERIAPNRGASRDGAWLSDTVTLIYLLSMLTDEQVRALKDGPFREPGPGPEAGAGGAER